MSYTSQNYNSRSNGAPDNLVLGLAAFSLGLGAAQVLAPHVVTRATGLESREALMQACGMREMSAGAGLLMADDPQPWLWGRVAGDILDLAFLATGLAGRDRQKSMAAMAAVAGVMALDVYAASAQRNGAARA